MNETFSKNGKPSDRYTASETRVKEAKANIAQRTKEFEDTLRRAVALDEQPSYDRNVQSLHRRIEEVMAEVLTIKDRLRVLERLVASGKGK